MAYEFREGAKIDDAGTIVFSIAYDKAQKRSPVRLEARASYVEDAWKLSWRDKDAVRKRMDVEKTAYLKKCEAAGLDNYNAIGVVQIG
jgi:DNA-dependent RNA polymerase auxiliary subunit epsilon